MGQVGEGVVASIRYEKEPLASKRSDQVEEAGAVEEEEEEEGQQLGFLVKMASGRRRLEVVVAAEVVGVEEPLYRMPKGGSSLCIWEDREVVGEGAAAEVVVVVMSRSQKSLVQPIPDAEQEYEPPCEAICLRMSGVVVQEAEEVAEAAKLSQKSHYRPGTSPPSGLAEQWCEFCCRVDVLRLYT